MGLVEIIKLSEEARGLSNEDLARALRDFVWAELNMDSVEAALVEEAIERLTAGGKRT